MENVCSRIYASDGGTDMKATFALSGEPWHPMITTPIDAPHLSTYESWQLNLEKYRVMEAWLKGWNATKEKTSTGQSIDGLLLPPSTNVAHAHGQWPR